MDVQSLSHQLHSSTLDYLGVVAAIRAFCGELSKQHQVSVEFTERNVPKHLPRDISLCLFRIAQEALHNAVKYSETNQFSVALCATEEEVQLVVRDAGAGFDVEGSEEESRIRPGEYAGTGKSGPWQVFRRVEARSGNKNLCCRAFRC